MLLFQSNRGLFFGLFVFALTIVAVTCYFVVGDHSLTLDKNNKFNVDVYGDHSVLMVSSLTFFATEMSLLFLLLVAATFALIQLQKLHLAW